MWLKVTDNGYGSVIEGVQEGMEDKFSEHLKPYLIRRTKAEALPGLPPKQRIDVWCTMERRQEEQYRTFASEAEWRIEDAESEGRVSATNVLDEYTRLKQFASSYCDVEGTDGDLKIIPTATSGKFNRLKEKLAEEGVYDKDVQATAIVFSQFKGMVNMITEELNGEGIPAEMITGDTKAKDRARIVKAFQGQTEGAPRVVVISTKAGGTAITLSRADSVHILDETWVPDDQEQAEDRAHRGDGLTMARESVRIYYYRTRNTIEEYIQQLVIDKQMNNDTILDLRRLMSRQELASVG